MLFRKPLPVRFVLHAVLIAGGAIFSLPFLWMFGTSMMTDKEIYRPGFHLLPNPPRPRPVSPYIDPQQTEQFERPEQIAESVWPEWRSQVKQAVRATMHELAVPYPSQIDPTEAEAEAIKHVWQQVHARMSPDVWRANDLPTLVAAIDKYVTADTVRNAIDACYRRFCVSHVQIRTRDFRQFKLTDPDRLADVWQVESGPARLVSAGQAAERHLEVRYNFNEGDALALVATLDLPTDSDKVLQVRISRRADETWHQLTAEIEMDGKLYETQRTEYMLNDNWGELLLQFYDPNLDEDPLRIKTWTAVKQVKSGPEYDHGPRRLLVRLRLAHSSKTEAWFGKAIHNYREALRHVPFWRYAATSVVLVILNIVLTLLSCSLVAYAFARLSWPGRDVLFMVLLGTMMIPGQVTMIPGFVIIRVLGWYNTLTPLWAFAAFGSAFNIFLLRQFMKGIPKDLEDAARIDGCGFLRVYWHVMMPLVKPTLAAIAIFTFMGTWNDFMGPLIYINDQRLYTLALGLFAFMTIQGGNQAMMMAGSIIMTVPIIVIFFFAQKYFIQGVTLTGMKA